MFRSRAPRSAVAAALSIALIAAFMVGTTSAATSQQGSDRAAAAAPKPKPSPTPTPTPVPRRRQPRPPTPNSDNRTVYFGDLDSHPDGDRSLVPSTVTAGNMFAFDVFIENEGNQRLTHPQVGYGESCRRAVERIEPEPARRRDASCRRRSTARQRAGSCTTAAGRASLCDLGQFDAG